MDNLIRTRKPGNADRVLSVIAEPRDGGWHETAIVQVARLGVFQVKSALDRLRASGLAVREEGAWFITHRGMTCLMHGGH